MEQEPGTTAERRGEPPGEPVGRALPDFDDADAAARAGRVEPVESDRADDEELGIVRPDYEADDEPHGGE